MPVKAGPRETVGKTEKSFVTPPIPAWDIEALKDKEKRQAAIVVFTPEHIVEGNDWIVSSWPRELETSYRADPEVKRREMPETWTPQMRNLAESWREVGRDATFAHMAHFFESLPTRKPSVEDAVFGNHAAIACHMANYSLDHKTMAVWDASSKSIKG